MSINQDIESLGGYGGLGGFGGGGFVALLIGLLLGEGGLGGLRGKNTDGCCEQPAGAVQLSDAIQTLQTQLCNNGKDTLRSEAAILANVNSNFGDLSRFLCTEFNGISNRISDLRFENAQQTSTILAAIQNNNESYLKDQLEKARSKGNNYEVIFQSMRGNGQQVATG